LEVTKITENRKRDKTLTIRLTDSEKKKIIAKSRKSKIPIFFGTMIGVQVFFQIVSILLEIYLN